MSEEALSPKRAAFAHSPIEEVLADQDIDLDEPSVLTPTFFSGMRTYVVNGIAHLLFYSEQPNSAGEVEFVVVARMIAPVPTAKAACARAAETMRLGRREGGAVCPRVVPN